MKVLDRGHVYELNHLDGDGKSTLKFVKREGEKFPGNVGHHEGTTLQEVLRACIERLEYVDGQDPCAETKATKELLVAAVFLLETRASRRHGHTLTLIHPMQSVTGYTCSVCGHVCCEVHQVVQ